MTEHKTLTDSLAYRFRAAARDHADRTALAHPGGTLDYRALDAATDRMAALLAARGVGPGTMVGVAAHRSAPTVVAILGILKAGAAYVPLPLDAPPARLAAMAEGCGLELVLGDLPDGALPGVARLDPAVALDDAGGAAQPAALPVLAPGALAYVMFTSGSTGTPKGVMVPQRAVLRLVQGQDFMSLRPGDRILQAAPLAFDAATLELWGALLNGATLVLAPDAALSLRDLGETLRRERITTLWLTAGLFHAMADERPADFAGLRQLLTGGDVVSPARVARVMATCPDLTVINGYGPTENTTFTCCHTIGRAEAEAGAPLPIGRAIAGTQVHVLDAALNPVADGAEGELCAAGAGLALGYLGRPDLTAERFVPAPWDPAVTLYRTGDRVRRDPDGVVHYLGRIDRQVKIRGHRIEPAAVEAALEAQPGIRAAAVVARAGADGADRMLVAHVVTDAAPDEAALKAALAATLDPASVPARIVRIGALPLNANGKVDRAALEAIAPPARTAAAPVAAVAAPADARARLRAARATVAAALAEVTGLDGADPEANFFDLGVSSLQIARLHARLETALDRRFPVAEMFAHPSVAALSRHLADAEGAPDLQPDADGTPRPGGSGGAPGGLIAIVGMAGRFPGAPDIASFWQGLVEGREMIARFSEDELDIPVPADTATPFVRARGILADPDRFDARHFGIPPREAERMDPQHRILLELAQAALDDAGHDPERFGGRIGIFAGVSQNSYLLNNLVSGPGAARAYAAGYPLRDFATLFGNDKDFLTTRVAYKLNLRGPAVTVQCACSTSLVAVAQACGALLRGEADMALAGGVSVTFPTRRAYPYMPDGMASQDGHCRAFDAGATGTVFGDGAGLVALRRLEDALADGDQVVAVIRGWAMNNDGAAKAGYAAPSVPAQAAVIRAAHAAAGVTPKDIGYVEAHGTGTPLGDPIEVAALTEAFAGAEPGSVALGTAKTHVGHLDIAAGVTGLIKTALTLRHGVIPGLLHYAAPNPRIDFAASAVAPVAALRAWPRGERPRRAGVSAFGVGGTNIHMVLEEAPPATAGARVTAPGAAPGADDAAGPDAGAGAPRVFPVSAATAEGLAAGVAALADWAEANPDANPDGVAATLRRGRRQMAQRTVLVARDMAGLAEAARGFTSGTAAGRPDRLAMLFPGQGAQHVGMAARLHAAEPVFRDAFDTCADLLANETGTDLRALLFHPDDPAQAAALLRDTSLAQPAIFATAFALARQWDHWGIAPDAMAGHSIGEFVAATLAGVFRLPDALRLIALRGRLMADLPRGVMLSVRASEDRVEPLRGGLDLAAVNGAQAVVLAGSAEAAADTVARLDAAGIVHQPLHTSHAFHSAMMDPALPAFRAAVAELDLRAPAVPILSTVTGDWLGAEQARDPSYWADHMRRPVRFHDAMERFRAEGGWLMLESGPGRTLATLAAQDPARRSPAVASLPHAQAAGSACDRSALHEAFGQLWAHGWPVDWSRLDAGRADASRRVPGLPGTGLHRERFWVEPAPSRPGTAGAGASAAQAAAPDAATTVDTTAAAPAAAEAPAAIDIGAALRAMLADLSGYDPAQMPGGARFLELGFDSLLLTQATRELSDRFGVTVTLRQLIDGYPTIDALAALIASQGGALAAPADRTPAAEMTRIEAPAPSATPAAPPAPVSGPMTRISTDSDALTPRQRAHIDRLTARYTARTAGSKALTARHRPTHADPRTASGFNRAWKEIVYQIVTTRSKGSRLLDVDGNEYIDILNGFGPGFLGHGPETVLRALHDQLDAGFEVGPQSQVAMEAAELFCQVTGNDRASFVCTGSEAVYAAMRLARTVTGRDRIVIFARDYHGNFDEVLVRGIDGPDGPRSLPFAPGVPRDAVRNMVVLPYGTPQSLDWIRRNAGSLAAVIVEPVQSRRPEFRPAEFIREVRRVTEAHGALFVFDEVVTGFRFGPRGAQGFYGVDADLVTYGKVVGGGMPVGVVSGKARFMDTFDGGQWAYGDDSFPQAPVTFFAGTFVRHPLVMAALREMLRFFARQPAFFWTSVNAKGDRLAGTIDRFCRDRDLPFRMPNCGSLMYLRIAEDQKFGPLLGAHLRDRGVFLLEGFPSYMTAAHDDEDIDHVIAAFKDSAEEMLADGMIAGRDAAPVRHRAAVQAPPPRLSLPGGAEAIGRAMAAPLAAVTVPATEAQREIWAAMLVTPEVSAAYNESVTLTLDGPVNRDALRAAMQDCVARHDGLRAGFTADGSGMTVAPVLDLDVPFTDLSGLPAADRDARLRAIVTADVETPFDLAAGPLVRAQLVALAADRHHLIVTAHHIVCDGWSIDVVMRDLGLFYTARCDGVRPALPPAQSIIDYARAEQEWAQSPAAQAARTYWLDRFAGPVPVLDLPTDRPRSGLRGVRGARIDRALPAGLTSRLRTLARAQGASFVNTLLAAYSLLVARLAQTDDVVIGLPASGQAARGMPGVVGHCVNLLPIRSRIDAGQGFDALLKQVQGTLLDAFDHQMLTFGELVRALKLPRDAGRVPLVPVIFNIDNGIDLSSMSFGPVQRSLVTNPRAYEHFEIYLNVTDHPDRVLTEWSYRTDLFDAATVERMVDRFFRLLDALARDPARPLGQVSALTDDERRLLLHDWQGKRADFPRDATLATLFADRVAAQPDAPAVIDGAATVRYRDLDARANAIAVRLRARGVGAGDIVGVCLDRSATMVAAMLAALRLGAAWLPLDPANPAARLALIAGDARAAVIVTTQALADRLGLAPALVLDDLTESECAAAPAIAPVPLPATATAYVAYTSGSTGRPKGVMGTHRATVNRFAWMWRDFPFQPGEVMCQKTAISFADSVWEIFGPLLAGVPQVVVPNDVVRDPVAFLRMLGAHGVTRLLVVPSLLRLVVDAGISLADAAPSLRWLFTSGEALPTGLARDFLAAAPQVTLVNLYGSSEVAADVTVEVVTGTGDGSVPIGRAIDNARLYVLDAAGALVPPGEVGELHVGGPVLASGYLHRPDLTAERFIPDPFAGEPGAVMFATGDRARWRSDGVLMFEGRRDHQVKLRGIRIELGEVEAALAALPGIEAAVATVRTREGGDPFLAAFVTAKPGARPDPQALRGALSAVLPEAMVPERIAVLDTMPLNANGKTDRPALAAMPLDTAGATGGSAPATETEADLHRLWTRLLGLSDIGVEDDFFTLGGHSLMAVRLFTHIRKRHGLELPISTLFAHPTIRSLARRIDGGTNGSANGAGATRALAPAGPAALHAPAAAPFAPHAGAPEDSPWDTTVVIHPGPAGGSAAPVFIVGGVGGNVNNLRDLGQELGAHRPVIGIQTRGVLGHRMHDSIEAMAADNIANIRRHQPRGPYRLAGYSGGAFTAFEMARQLQAAGEAVAWLGVLDMYAPGFAVDLRIPFGARLKIEARAIADRGFGAFTTRLRRKVRDRLLTDRVVRLGARALPDRFRHWSLVQHWVSLVPRYRPGPLAGDMRLYATRGEGFSDARIRAADPEFGWTGLVTGAVRVDWLDCGHLDMLVPPHVADLARRIAADLAAADATPPPFSRAGVS